MGTLHYRLRIRTADDSADALVLSSVPGDDHPYLAIPEDGPSGDGQTIDPVTGESMVGAYMVPVIDVPGTVAVTTEVWRLDIGALADLSAWVETDPSNFATFSLDATHILTNSQAIRVHVPTGAGTPGYLATLTLDVTGLNPGQTYTYHRAVYATGNTSLTPNTWYPDFFPETLVADGSGTVTVDVFVSFGGVNSGSDYWYDSLYLTTTTGETARVITGTLADADGRWDILDRKAVLEESEDVGSTWDVLCAGYVTDVKLDNALVAGITVSETRRADSTLRIFDKYEGIGQPTCIIGGPVEGGFAGVKDYGPAVFKVTATDALTVTLQYESGPLPPLYFDFAARHLTDTAIAEINRLARGYFFRDATWTATTSAVGYFPDVVARLYSATAGTLTGEFTPIAAPPIIVAGIMPVLEDRLLDSDGKLRLDWPSSGSPAQPSTGTRFNLYAFPTPISADNPLHLSGHPIDLDTAVYDVRGVAYDAASAASVKAALGPVSALYRLTGGDTTGAWLVKNLRGPCGYTVRQNDAGEREYILVRPHPTATPTATITLDALRGGDDGPEGVVFDLDSASKRNVVTLNVQTFRRWLDADKDAGVSRPPDFILTTPASVTEELDSDADGTPDWETQGRKEITYDLPGRLQIGDPTSKSLFGGATDLITSIAHEVFAIRGRGAPVGDAMILRGTDADAARVGDFVLVNCDHIPSTDTTQSPTGVRGGTVVAQVLRRTRVAGGADLHLEYRGTATQTGLTPTFTVTKNTNDPRHTATFTLTNGPALAAAGAVVRVQMATGTSTPTAGAPLRVIDPSVTTSFDLPGQDAGTKVWASARAEVGVEAPGAYTAFAGVQLDSLTAPSSLSASASSNVVAMSWTVGDVDVPEEIIFKLSGEADYRAPIPVAAGTDHYTLILPTAGTWTVGVRGRESPPYNGVSSAATASVTTSTASALTAPVNPAVFSDGAGTWSLAADVPFANAQMEVYVAVETAVGSGTFGSYASAGTPVAAVLNGRTVFSAFAPNDGKLRSVEARTIQDGATASAFTTPLSINPWTQTAAPPEMPVLTGTLDSAGHIAVTWTNGSHALSIRLAAATGSAPSDGTVTAATAVNGQTGSFTATVTANTQAFVKAIAYSGSGGTGTASPAVTITLNPAGGAVTSVFSRTGAVVAVSGDYAFNQISGTAGATQGGTGLSSYALGDLLYASATNTLAKLVGNTTTTKKFLSQTGTGSVSAAPAWGTIALGDLGTGSPSSSNFLRGDGTWAVPSGGGGSSPQWVTDDAQTQPGSAGAIDDEFTGTTSQFNTDWTRLNFPAAYDVNTTAPGKLWLRIPASSGGDRIMYKALPAGDFTFWSKVTMVGRNGDFILCAPILSSTNTIGSGSQHKAWMLGVHSSYGTVGCFGVETMTNNNGTSATTVENVGGHLHGAVGYVRVRRVGTSVYYATGVDGQGWIEAGPYTLGFTANYIGLDFYAALPRVTEITVDFVRYSTSGTAIL
jgi:hypothetical protein